MNLWVGIFAFVGVVDEGVAAWGKLYGWPIAYEKYSKILESLYSDSPIYLMSNVYQVTSQCGLNTSNGLCGEVVATCEPLGNLGISLVEHSGKVFLGETLFFQNLTQSLCDAKRQVKLSFLFGRNCCKAITEKFILYHNY